MWKYHRFHYRNLLPSLPPMEIEEEEEEEDHCSTHCTKEEQFPRACF